MARINYYPSVSCIIPVCHGSQDMHGKRFKEYVEEAAKHFRRAHLVVCDTLDVHNMAPSADMRAEALSTARAMGDLWLKKHHAYVHDAFCGNVTLKRWDDMKADPSFKMKYTESVRLYDEKPEVKEWVDDICMTYARIAAIRQEQKGFIADIDKLFQRSLAYMLEEIAGTSVYYNLYKCPAVYPGQYFDDPSLFNRQNPVVDLSVPPHCAVYFDDQSTSSTVAA